MRIDAYGSEAQYLHHLVPVWIALDPDERGEFFVAHGLEGAAARQGVAPSAIRAGYPPGSPTPTLVASYQDHRICARFAHRPVVYLEHGAGQTYLGDPNIEAHPSYSGGPDHEGTILFLAPREEVAERWRSAYPDVPALAVGSPRLDPWATRSRQPGAQTRRSGAQTREPVVAVSFHSDVALCPETRSAWSWFHPGLPAVTERWQVLGHGHPRIFPRIAGHWRQMGAEPVADFEEVLARADLYVVDNSSTGFEFMATGRPGVWLDPPWYRRRAHHGLRFWELSDGALHADQPDDLADVVAAALADPAEVARRRSEVAELVFPLRDGRATERAVAAIRDACA